MVSRARDGANGGPRQFLDEDDIEIEVNLKNSIHNKIVFSNILQKDFDIVENHILALFTAE